MMPTAGQFQGSDEDLERGRTRFNADLAEAGLQHEKGELSDEEQQAIVKKMEALKKFFEDSHVNATYKIEVQFGRGRSNQAAFPGSLHLYRSGSVLSGGGDEIVYQCPDDRCLGVILPEHLLGPNAACPVCQKVFQREKELHDVRLFRLPYQKWADVLFKMFHRLNMDADIYLKTHVNDIRDATLKEQMRQRHGEHYLQVRKRVAVMYSLENIMRDVNGGSDLLKRLRALVVA